MTKHSSPVTAPPADLTARIALYLDDAPHGGGHSDAAGANCWELLAEALVELRSRPAQQPASPENELESVTQAIWQAHKDNLHLRMTDVYRVMGVAAVEAMRANAQGAPEDTDAEIEAWIRTLDDEKDRNLVMWMERALRAEKKLSEINGKLFANAQSAPEPVVEVRAALANLVAKLNEVHRDPRFKSVWTVNQLHAGQYSGPTYTEELDAAEAALAALSVTSTDGGGT